MSSEPIRSPATEPGAGLGPLSAAELDALLREPIVARLGTVDADGYPVIVPIWTEWDGSAIWLVVRSKADYAANLRDRPKVCLSVVRPDAADTRALILGRAEIIEGPGPLSGRLEDVARRMAHRYEGEAGDRYINDSRGWPRLLVRVVPDRIVSWGHPDWHPRYR
jgi:PPOX class probable F420-dependent enzyme